MTELKIRTHGNENLSKAIQDEFFKLGYQWFGRNTEYFGLMDDVWIYARSRRLGWNPVRLDTRQEYKEVTIYDLIEMNAQKSTKQEEIRAIRKEMEAHNKVGEELAARLKEVEK